MAIFRRDTDPLCRHHLARSDGRRLLFAGITSLAQAGDGSHLPTLPRSLHSLRPSWSPYRCFISSVFKHRVHFRHLLYRLYKPTSFQRVNTARYSSLRSNPFRADSVNALSRGSVFRNLNRILYRTVQTPLTHLFPPSFCSQHRLPYPHDLNERYTTTNYGPICIRKLNPTLPPVYVPVHQGHILFIPDRTNVPFRRHVFHSQTISYFESDKLVRRIYAGFCATPSIHSHTHPKPTDAKPKRPFGTPCLRIPNIMALSLTVTDLHKQFLSTPHRTNAPFQRPVVRSTRRYPSV